MAASPTTSFDTTRLRFGDMIAGISGLVLLISLFLNWYNVSAKVNLFGVKREQSQGISGWSALSFIDILLFVIAVAAIAIAVLRALNMIPSAMPASAGLIILALGALALLLVLFRLISIPHAGDVQQFNGPGIHVGLGRSFGIFIALLSAAGVTIGGWLNWKEEGQPRPGSAGAGGAPGRGPLAAGQPGAGGQPGGGAAAQPFAQPPQQAAPAQASAAAEPAAAQTGGQAKADWYPDPRGEKRLRYYDGTQWTEHTAD